MKRVLLVDDDPKFLELIRVRLEAAGYRVETASDGAQALAKIQEGRPDIVFLDIQIPEPDGLEVLKKIRKQDKDLPVYMLTAFVDPARFKSANQLQASGFIPKTNNLFQEIQNVTAALKLSEKYRAGKRRGFTLMELMVSLVLLVAGLTAVIGVFSTGVLASADRENTLQALRIAQAKLESLMATDPDALTSSGPTADPTFTNYTVTMAVTGTNPKEAAVTVAWIPQGGQTSLTLTTQVADLD